jgi:hypothetical protein
MGFMDQLAPSLFALPIPAATTQFSLAVATRTPVSTHPAGALLGVVAFSIGLFMGHH